MLSKLTMNNFQAHLKSEIEFCDGVNIITGSSNSGKTSIIRCLDLIMNNNPRGTGYINDDNEEMEASLEFVRNKTEYVVKRIRNRKSKNIYEVTCNGKTEPINAGTHPPLEIASCLNISDINIQKQLSPYFLVLDSPGKKASYIRKIAKLDEIDNIISVLSGKGRDCSKEITRLNTELETYNKKIEEVDKIDIEKLEAKIIQATAASTKLSSERAALVELFGIISQLKQIEEDMISLPDDIDKQIKVLDISAEIFCGAVYKHDTLSEIVECLRDLKSNKVTLPDDISDKIEKLDINNQENIDDVFEQNTLKEIVESLHDLEANKINLPNDIKSKLLDAETTFNEYNISITQNNVLEEILSKLVTYGTEVDELKLEETKMINDEQKLLAQLDHCPSCEMKLTSESKQILLEKW